MSTDMVYNCGKKKNKNKNKLERAQDTAMQHEPERDSCIQIDCNPLVGACEQLGNVDDDDWNVWAQF